MYRRQEHKAFQMVQILKRDIMEESPDTEGGHTVSDDAATCTKTKKSLFATLIKRNHTKRPKVKITKKIETCSTINFNSESGTSEENLERYIITATNQKKNLVNAIPTATRKNKSKRYNFFQKIIKKSKFDFPNSRDDAPYEGRKDESENKISNSKSMLQAYIPTSYIPKYNIKLINGINELQNILQNLYHCEEHMVYMLKKYIEDKSFQNQLLQSSFDYFALQYDAKCQSNVLVNGLWLQQSEIAKTQEHNLQKRLNFLVKTNRTLQLHIENLNRHCEKFASRTKLYPKRFLHLRSFSKNYARHLIDNNKKLQNKVKALTEIISDFEEEIQKLQAQQTTLEEEKRVLKTDIYHIEGVLERHLNDHELEKTALMSRLSNQTTLIKDSEQASKHIFQDLISFEMQVQELNIHINWPNFICQDACLIEIIYQIRTCVRELLTAMITEYRNVTSIAKDVTKLRNTNARLQENLQKSTNELDNLSKKFERNTKEFDNTLEMKCSNLQQENYSLKLKMETVIQEKKDLEQKLEAKERIFDETKANFNDISTKNSLICNQIDEFLQIVLPLNENDFSKEFSTNQEKLEYIRLRYIQASSDLKHLNEKFRSLEEENQNLIQNQKIYQQDLNGLQDGITLLSAENDFIKKQLATEHQTVNSLQNERIKYLEEKNILKTVFQHLRSEVSRIQHLEGAVADMSKETNRLALIAEFNKQLGEKLRNEIDVKENTIVELRQSLEKLSHIQLDSDKERMSLCAQLSEVSSVKDKLTNYLETELKKNIHLDESKKKLESSTKSQLKIFEEMQKNERTALKELLKDFKALIKQRDYLVQMQDQNKKKQHEFEKYYNMLKKQHENALIQLHEKENDIKQLEIKIEDQEKFARKLEEESSNNNSKYEKTIRKLEKLLGQVRQNKEELENCNVYLKTTLQKVNDDLNEAKKNESEAANKLSIKAAENAAIEKKLDQYKSDLQVLSQENCKLKIEIEYLNKLCEKQTVDMQNTISQVSSKDNTFLEAQTTILNKDQEINQLHKIIFEHESKFLALEQECNRLKKENEDQNRIMIGYEDQLVILSDLETSKSKSEKEFHNLQLEHEVVQNDLENARKEIENLHNQLEALMIKSENEKSFYKNQAHELICEYSEQKENIEEEIDNISKQLQQVTDNLTREQQRFEELTMVHDDLKAKFVQIKENLSCEIAAHKNTCSKLEKMDGVVKSLMDERDNLQHQIHSLLTEINEEKDKNVQLSNKNRNIHLVLEQGSQKYNTLLARNTALEKELKEVKFKMENITNCKDLSESEMNKSKIKLEETLDELKAAKETIDCLTKELNENQTAMFNLKEDFFKLQQQVTGLEFTNCELTLQLHETQGKLATERTLYKEIKELKLEDKENVEAGFEAEQAEGRMAPSQCGCGELFY